jgi:predicted histone-like DNA-binding protein
MAKLRIKKYTSTKESNNGYGKTYARLIHQDTMTTNDLCRHIMKHGTIFTPDVVKGTIERFIMCFEELLLEGNKIKLDGLGTFYLTISTEGAADADKFTASNVKSVRVRFLPDQSKESEYTSKMLTNKARFLSVDGEEISASEGGEGEQNNG